ncbi:unnamed protein product [Coffea canephora]|uniref:Glutathione S-transferase n=1 Tax=Coffea canephora TaxID=49390 RepID=A0A068VM34_COFCA|nr:unnamed protein product [Coffea canephora]
MAEESKVVLHSFFASPYAKRVELALKIKGIPFKYTLQTVSKLYEPNNEGQEKIVEEVHEKLKILEDGVKKFYFPEGSPVHIDAEKLGILDIMVFATFGGYKAQEQVLGVKIIDAEQTPLIFSWLQAPNEVPVIKESAVPHDHLVGLRQFLTQSAGSQ